MFNTSTDVKAMRAELAQWRALLEPTTATTAAKLLTIISIREQLQGRSGEPAGIRAVLREHRSFAEMRDLTRSHGYDKLTNALPALQRLATVVDGTGETLYALIHSGAMQWNEKHAAYRLVIRKAA